MSGPEEKPPLRGEVWWIAFDPSVGTEIQKTRPAVIISNNASNRALSRYQVVPLSSKTEKIYPSNARVTVKGGKMAKALADQITTIDRARLKNRFCTLSLEDLAEVERVVKIQLGLR